MVGRVRALDPSQRQSLRLEMLNFTDAEYEELERAAGEQGVSAYLREITLRHLRRPRKIGRS